MGMISFSRRLSVLADASPDHPAITCGDRSLTRAQLESAANRLACDLGAGGVGLGDMVTIALPNSTDWYVAVAACWKVGAIPQPVSARLPEPELSAILELADPPAVIGVPGYLAPGRRALPAGYQPDPDVHRRPVARYDLARLEGTYIGGSTGVPK